MVQPWGILDLWRQKIQVKSVLFFQSLWEIWWRICWDHVYVPWIHIPDFMVGPDDAHGKTSKTFWGLQNLWQEIRKLRDTCVVTVSSFSSHTCRERGTRLVNSWIYIWFKLMEFGFMKNGFINWNAQLASQVEIHYSLEY